MELPERITLGSTGNPISFVDKPPAIGVAGVAVDANVPAFAAMVARAAGDGSAFL